MKLLTFLLFSFSFYSCFSQFIKLKAHNPAPREGEEISINYELKWPDQENTKGLGDDKPKNYKAKGELNISDYVLTGNKVLVGPISFAIDGQIFKSDTFSLQIFPPLPNRKDGFWPRLVRHQGEYFLITEQRISGEWKRKQEDKNSFSMTFDSEGIEFAKITESTVKIDDVEVRFSYSTYRSQELTGEGIVDTETVHYKMHVYTLKLPENYSKSAVIKKNHFSNFPKRIDLEPIVIGK